MLATLHRRVDHISPSEISEISMIHGFELFGSRTYFFHDRRFSIERKDLATRKDKLPKTFIVLWPFLTF